MSAFSAKVVQHSINQLLINTINDAEKMLLDLPRDGDRVEVITSSSHEVRSHSACGFGPRKTTQDVVVDTTSQMTPTPKSDELQRKLGYPEESTSGSTEGESNKGSSQASSLPRDKPSPSGLRLKRKTDGERKSSKSPKKIAENAIKRVLPDKAEVVPGSVCSKYDRFSSSLDQIMALK
ncbi:hypothetical protein COOONC_07850 [Cooperia oncophora]